MFEACKVENCIIVCYSLPEYFVKWFLSHLCIFSTTSCIKHLKHDLISEMIIESDSISLNKIINVL